MSEPKTIEELIKAIEFVRLGIENELLRRKIYELIDDFINREEDASQEMQ